MGENSSGSAMPSAEDLRLAAEVTRAQAGLRGRLPALVAAQLAEMTAGMTTEEAIAEVKSFVGEVLEHALRGLLSKAGLGLMAAGGP